METPEGLEWRLDIGAQQPKKRIMVLVFACIAAYIGFVAIGPTMAAIGFVVVLIATADFLIPLKYRLDEKGASVRCGLSVTSMPWSEVKRLIQISDGIRLSPLEKPSRLDEFRGVYLRFANNESEVSAKIREFWHGDTSALGRGSNGTGDRGTGELSGEADSEAEA